MNISKKIFSKPQRIILIFFICFMIPSLSLVINTAQGYGGGGGGGGGGDGDELSTNNTSSVPVGEVSSLDQLAQAMNTTPQPIREIAIDRSIQTAINFMDENATVEDTDSNETTRGDELLGQRLGEIVVELLIFNPEMKPKEALGLAILLLYLEERRASDPTFPAMIF